MNLNQLSKKINLELGNVTYVELQHADGGQRSLSGTCLASARDNYGRIHRLMLSQASLKDAVDELAISILGNEPLTA